MDARGCPSQEAPLLSCTALSTRETCWELKAVSFGNDRGEGNERELGINPI